MKSIIVKWLLLASLAGHPPSPPGGPDGDYGTLVLKEFRERQAPGWKGAQDDKSPQLSTLIMRGGGRGNHHRQIYRWKKQRRSWTPFSAPLERWTTC